MEMVFVVLGMVFAGLWSGIAGLAFGLAAFFRGRMKPHFFWPCLLTTLFSAFAQYAIALQFLRLPAKSEIDLLFAAICGWHLLPPFLLAGLLAVPAHRSPDGRLMGVVAGLFLSVAAVIALSWPMSQLAFASLFVGGRH
jgi:uncharacterized membrane protein HdeD (DUF308 family)